MDILIATTNPGKLREYRAMLADLPVTLLSLDEVGLAGMDVEETGTTFDANALLKAQAYARASGKTTLADDSGLCVDALDGAPGVYSARYGGAGLDDRGRRMKLLGALKETPDEQRTARFECVIVLADADGERLLTAMGICQGRIAHDDMEGPQGFGYDAIFIPEDHDKSFAQFEKDEKNRISHRGRATAAFKQSLREMLT